MNEHETKSIDPDVVLRDECDDYWALDGPAVYVHPTRKEVIRIDMYASRPHRKRKGTLDLVKKRAIKMAHDLLRMTGTIPMDTSFDKIQEVLDKALNVVPEFRVRWCIKSSDHESYRSRPNKSRPIRFDSDAIGLARRFYQALCELHGKENVWVCVDKYTMEIDFRTDEQTIWRSSEKA